MEKKEIISFKSSEELLNHMLNMKGSSMATLVTITEPKVTKKNRFTKVPYEIDFPKGKILCEAKRFGSIGNDYTISVSNRLESENKTDKAESFQAMPRTWGEPVEGSNFLIQYNNSYYLKFFYLNKNSELSEKKYYYSNGSQLTPEEVQKLEFGYLPVKHSDSGRQETDNPIIINNIKIDNIFEMRTFGKIYQRKEYSF
jgi:hypothetical protein